MSSNKRWKEVWRVTKCNYCTNLTGWRYWSGYRWIYRCFDCHRKQNGFTRDRLSELNNRKLVVERRKKRHGGKDRTNTEHKNSKSNGL